MGGSRRARASGQRVIFCEAGRMPRGNRARSWPTRLQCPARRLGVHRDRRDRRDATRRRRLRVRVIRPRRVAGCVAASGRAALRELAVDHRRRNDPRRFGARVNSVGLVLVAPQRNGSLARPVVVPPSAGRVRLRVGFSCCGRPAGPTFSIAHFARGGPSEVLGGIHFSGQGSYFVPLPRFFSSTTPHPRQSSPALATPSSRSSS